MKRLIATLVLITLLTTCCTAFADAFSEMLTKADSYQSAGDNEKAIASYQLAQKINPESEDGYLGEARVRVILGEYDSAVSLVDKVLDINPVSVDAWRLKCRIDVLKNDIPSFEADNLFASVCDVDLSDEYLPIAIMYTNAGMYEKAVSYFSLLDMMQLDEPQKELYRKSLVASGNRDEAENLGLVSASVRNRTLDALFDANTLTLVKTAPPVIDADKFDFTTDMWAAMGVEEPTDPLSELAKYLPEAEITWLSFSPSGNSGILVADGHTPIALYDGRYHVLYPSHLRGVEDTNKNLAKYYSVRLQSLIGDEGVVYSNDGRYAGIYSVRHTLMYANFFIDPVIIDLATGEMILTATYKNRIREENAGAVTTATFSTDGKYLYYILYGNTSRSGYKTSMYRYNLETAETEFCYSGSDFTYYPSLSETADGNFIIIRDTFKTNELLGVYSISFQNGLWAGNEHIFDLPTKYWRCNRLFSSSNSGYALIPGSIGVGSVNAFKCFRPDEEFLGIEHYYAISKDGNKIVSMGAGDVSSIFDEIANNPMRNGDTMVPFDVRVPFQTILTLRISPDGYYALLNTIDKGTADDPKTTYHLYLVRLEDMAIKEVWGVDPEDILVGSLGANYQPVIEWNTDVLLINTSEGVQAYRFQ